MKKHVKKIVALCTALVLVAGLTACGGGMSPTETVDTFLKGVKAADSESISKVYEDDSFNLTEDISEDDDEFLNKELAETMKNKLYDFDYKIVEEKIKDDKATVTVEITTYQMGDAFAGFMEDYFTKALSMAFEGKSEKDIEKYANNLMVKKMKKVKKDYVKEVDITLTNKDGGWIIDEIPEEGDLVNALTGGMIETLKDYESILDD